MPDSKGFLSAGEVDKMDERQYKWFVFDMLQKGNKYMKENHDELKQLRKEHCELVRLVEEHITTRKIHTPINSKPQPVREWLLDWRLIIAVATAAGIIIATIITNL